MARAAREATDKPGLQAFADRSYFSGKELKGPGFQGGRLVQVIRPFWRADRQVTGK